MSTATMTRGATNYLQDAFHVQSVDKLASDEAASLCEDAELDPNSEAGELWKSYCAFFGLAVNQTVEKFRNSKFYREHL